MQKIQDHHFGAKSYFFTSVFVDISSGGISKTGHHVDTSHAEATIRLFPHRPD
jgi:hypothetical protein